MNNTERANLANTYITGYAKGLITDEECNDMIDLIQNETNTLMPVAEDIKIECSADQDWAWHYESE